MDLTGVNIYETNLTNVIERASGELFNVAFLSHDYSKQRPAVGHIFHRFLAWLISGYIRLV